MKSQPPAIELSDREARLLRLESQGLNEQAAPAGAVSIVRRQCAIQAQDVTGSAISLWARGAATIKAVSYDNYLLAYRDRGLLIDTKYTKKVNAGGGLLRPTVICDGRVVGRWRKTSDRGSPDIAIELFEPIPARVRDRLSSEILRLKTFLGMATG